MSKAIACISGQLLATLIRGEVKKQSLSVIWGKSLSVARESASYLEGFTRVKQDGFRGLVSTLYGNNNRKERKRDDYTNTSKTVGSCTHFKGKGLC
jgi:hypothetical protein